MARSRPKTAALSPSPAGNTETSRSTYTLGGQAIATRVLGDPPAGNNGLFYIFSDHLGSTSVLATSSGNQVPGSKTSYYPFGSPRTTLTQTITDRNFTGQKENLELGLIYYNARYYLPGSGRFLTPDTIIPDPLNPQQFNRYAYTLNNPTNFTDPSGHICYDPSTGDAIPGDCGQSSQTAPHPFPPVPIVEIVFTNGVFDPEATWSGLSRVDLLTRLILSEESYKVLDPIMYQDAVGVAWVAMNRTQRGSGYSYAENNLLEAIIAPNQFAGMTTLGNANRAANPEAYPEFFASGNPDAGREAYWRAYEIAQGIVNSTIPDPTLGRLVYADALLDGTHRERTAFWYTQDGSPNDPHLTIPQIQSQQRAIENNHRLRGQLLITN